MVRKDVNFDFPAGRIRTIPIAATAGNVNADLAVPAGKQWRILSSHITLVTDATVVNRTPYVEKRNGTDVTEPIGFGGSWGASNTVYFSMGEAVTLYGTGAGLGHRAGASYSAYIGIQNLYLGKDDLLRISIVNGVAGDSYQGFLSVLEVDV